MRGLTWDEAKRLYRPNTGRGNFQGDVLTRGANRMLFEILVLTEMGNEEGIQATFRQWDLEDQMRSEATLARINERLSR